VQALRPSAGTAHVTFARAGADTVVERCFATSPIKLFSTRRRSGACWIYGATLGGGFVGGDAVQMTVAVRSGASALLTTQASTKIYRSLKPASQSIHADIADAALLAVIPDPVVCFRGADFTQTQRYALAPTADLILLDWFTSGRHARGERWEWRRYCSRIEITRDGRRILYDGITLQRDADSVAQRMGRFEVFATCVVTGPRLVESAAALIAASSSQPIETNGDIIESACPLRDGGTLVRIAGTSVEGVGRWLRGRLSFSETLLGDDLWRRKW
jgi:urease accessory protein